MSETYGRLVAQYDVIKPIDLGRGGLSGIIGGLRIMLGARECGSREFLILEIEGDEGARVVFLRFVRETIVAGVEDHDVRTGILMLFICHLEKESIRRFSLFLEDLKGRCPEAQDNPVRDPVVEARRAVEPSTVTVEIGAAPKA